MEVVTLASCTDSTEMRVLYYMAASTSATYLFVACPRRRRSAEQAWLGDRLGPSWPHGAAEWLVSRRFSLGWGFASPQTMLPCLANAGLGCQQVYHSINQRQNGDGGRSQAVHRQPQPLVLGQSCISSSIAQPQQELLHGDECHGDIIRYRANPCSTVALETALRENASMRAIYCCRSMA